jgi:hypothetical protein
MDAQDNMVLNEPYLVPLFPIFLGMRTPRRLKESCSKPWSKLELSPRTILTISKRYTPVLWRIHHLIAAKKGQASFTGALSIAEGHSI